MGEELIGKALRSRHCCVFSWGCSGEVSFDFAAGFRHFFNGLLGQELLLELGRLYGAFSAARRGSKKKKSSNSQPITENNTIAAPRAGQRDTPERAHQGGKQELKETQNER